MAVSTLATSVCIRALCATAAPVTPLPTVRQGSTTDFFLHPAASRRFQRPTRPLSCPFSLRSHWFLRELDSKQLPQTSCKASPAEQTSRTSGNTANEVSSSSGSSSIPEDVAAAEAGTLSLDAAMHAMDKRLAQVQRLQQLSGSDSGSGNSSSDGPNSPGKAGSSSSSSSSAWEEEERQVLKLLRALQAKGVIRGFGGASQVPRRTYTVDELRLHKIDTSKLLAPKDTTLSGIRSAAQISLVAGLLSMWLAFDVDQLHLLFAVVSVLAVGTIDQILTGGGFEQLALDSLGNALSSRYRERVAQHEAGHFLIAYLVGIPPGGYSLSSADAFAKYGALKVQAGTTFIDIDFQDQVKSGKLSSETLDKVACIALAGVCAEYLKFGESEGGLSDITELDSLFRSLRFTQKKSDDVVRWAVLNVVTLLRRHEQVHSMLARQMAQGTSVGKCITTIERELTCVTDV